MTLADLFNLAIPGVIPLISPTDFGDEIYPVKDGEAVPSEVLLRCAREGRFYVLGGRVVAHDAWHVEDSPRDEDASRIKDMVGLPVTQLFRRTPSPPAPPRLYLVPPSP